MDILDVGVTHADMYILQGMDEVKPAVLLLANRVRQHWYFVFLQNITGQLRVTVCRERDKIVHPMLCCHLFKAPASYWSYCSLALSHRYAYVKTYHHDPILRSSSRGCRRRFQCRRPEERRRRTGCWGRWFLSFPSDKGHWACLGRTYPSQGAEGNKRGYFSFVAGISEEYTVKEIWSKMEALAQFSIK